MKKKTIITALLALVAMAGQGQVYVGGEDFVYLLPSKEIYETGEDMWFKAYLFNRQTFALSDNSKTLYLQIRNANDSVVWNEKYPLVHGRGDGHIYIGDDWQNGDYYIEGYPPSSLSNDSSAAIRPRRIYIVRQVAQMDSIITVDTKKDSILRENGHRFFRLFPEGGRLVDGIGSLVAFKATYSDGFPEDVSGKVLEDGQDIISFSCEHDGMGKFLITPRKGRKYEVILADGRVYPLPTIESDGLALHLIRLSKTEISLLVSSTSNETRPFSVFAQMRGIPCCSAKGNVKGKQIVRLPIDNFLYQGIAEITLVDGKGNPVAERLVYVNPDKNRLHIEAKPNRQSYHRREEGKVSLKVTNESGRSVMSELAVSIFDKAYVYQPGHENILSHCFLSTQIRGNIFNPTYYFDEQNTDRLQALDLLLLTQGWRKYENKQSGKSSMLSDAISGRITISKKQNSAYSQQLLRVFTPQSDTCYVWSDENGHFDITPDQMNFLRGNVYIKPLSNKKYKAQILLDNPFDSINDYRRGLPRYTTLAYHRDNDNDERTVINGFGTVMLDNVTVTARRHSPYRDKVTGYLDSLATMASGEWVCECHAASSRHYLNGYKGYSHHPDGCSATSYSGKRLMPKRDEDYELIRYEPMGGGGDWVVTDIKTIKYAGPQYTEEELLKLYGMWKDQGYYPQREFYEPTPLELASSLPDPRNTLQWKPIILTNENGEAEVEFITSDVNTEFIGIVEAIDGNGQIGCDTFTFRVIRNK